MTDEQKAAIDAAVAEVRYWVDGYVAAGFSEEQALQLVCRTQVIYNAPQYPPEFFEHMERQTALANKLLTEIDE